MIFGVQKCCGMHLALVTYTAVLLRQLKSIHGEEEFQRRHILSMLRGDATDTLKVETPCPPPLCQAQICICGSTFVSSCARCFVLCICRFSFVYKLNLKHSNHLEDGKLLLYLNFLKQTGWENEYRIHLFQKGGKRRDVLNILINIQRVNMAQIFNAYPANVENMVSRWQMGFNTAFIGLSGDFF
jgi:hypothetical protein